VEDAGVDAGALTVSGRDATLEGAVASLGVGDAVEACIAAIPGIRVVNNNLQIIAVEQPPEPEVIREPPNLDLESLLQGIVVEFPTDGAYLTTQERPEADEIVAILKANRGRVEIAGHADSRYTSEYNLALSQRRAEAVKKYLVSKGLDADRFEVVWFGETRPIASNDTAAGQQKNRRTEFRALKEN
jgi:outer membrane protein OmpA-like peptidoglycan-associated protein